MQRLSHPYQLEALSRLHPNVYRHDELVETPVAVDGPPGFVLLRLGLFSLREGVHGRIFC